MNEKGDPCAVICKRAYEHISHLDQVLQLNAPNSRGNEKLHQISSSECGSGIMWQGRITD